MVPNRRTEEKERERGVEIRPLFLSFSLEFFGSEPYAALTDRNLRNLCIVNTELPVTISNPCHHYLSPLGSPNSLNRAKHLKIQSSVPRTVTDCG